MPRDLDKEIALLKQVIEQLIVWIASSETSPISREDAKNLIELLNSKN